MKGMNMQPLGRVPVKFPGKKDQARNKDYQNWWEYEIGTESKKTHRQNEKKMIKEYKDD